MHREFYTRLISRAHPLPEAFVPEHLIDIGLPFEAAPGDPKRLLEYQAVGSFRISFLPATEGAFYRKSFRCRARNK